MVFVNNIVRKMCVTCLLLCKAAMGLAAVSQRVQTKQNPASEINPTGNRHGLPNISAKFQHLPQLVLAFFKYFLLSLCNTGLHYVMKEKHDKEKTNRVVHPYRAVFELASEDI